MEDFHPYAAPDVEIGPKIVDGPRYWRDRDALIMTKDAILPDRCVKCNVCTERRLKRDLSWHPSVYYLLFLSSPILYFIVARFVRKTANMYVPFCDDHVRSRRWAIAVWWLASLSSTPVMILGATTNLPSGFALGVGLTLILVGVFYGVIKCRLTETKKIDKRFVWLTNVHPDFLAKLPDWSS